MPDLLFTAADLAEMRAFNAANLPHTALIQESATSSAGGGELTTVWSTILTKPCRLAPSKAAMEQLAAGAIREIKDFDVSFAYDVPARANHRIIVTHDSPGLVSPATLSVTGVEARTYEMQRNVAATLVGGL